MHCVPEAPWNIRVAGATSGIPYENLRYGALCAVERVLSKQKAEGMSNFLMVEIAFREDIDDEEYFSLAASLLVLVKPVEKRMSRCLFHTLLNLRVFPRNIAMLLTNRDIFPSTFPRGHTMIEGNHPTIPPLLRVPSMNASKLGQIGGGLTISH